MTISADKSKRIGRVYHNTKLPGGLSGPVKVLRRLRDEGVTGINLQDVKDFLSAQDSFTLHKVVKRKFARNKIAVTGIGEQYEMDLCDYSSLAKYNDNFKYILVVIDVFSKMVWVQLLKSKTSGSMVAALSELFKVVPPVKLARTDRGGEFCNKAVAQLFQNKGIHHFTTENEPKCAICERMIRNIRSKLARYFTWKQTHRYIDVLPDIIHAYNNTWHSSIQMAPSSVNKSNESAVFWMLYAPKKSKKKPAKLKPYKFSIGSHVRVSALKGKFMREKDHRWTGEIFEIAGQSRRDGINVYVLRDYNKEKISGRWYEEELQLVHISPDTVWKVEKVLKTRKRKGQEREHLVSWLHWPKSYNSWILASDLEDYK